MSAWKFFIPLFEPIYILVTASSTSSFIVELVPVTLVSTYVLVRPTRSIPISDALSMFSKIILFSQSLLKICIFKLLASRRWRINSSDTIFIIKPLNFKLWALSSIPYTEESHNGRHKLHIFFKINYIILYIRIIKTKNIEY